MPSARESTEVGALRSLNQDEQDLNDIDEVELLSVFWNQDYGCFAAGTSCGFRIYNCDPFKETFRRDLGNGGFKIVEMLFRCNILALVGSGSNSQHPPNKVLIWDDYKSQCIGEFSFRSEVRAVKLKRDRLVVVLEHKIYIYALTDLKLLHQIETVSNPKGLCCLSHHTNTSVLACPGLQRGQVHVEHFGLNMTKLINAHDSHIACFTMTMDGLLLATASTKGTLIRIFNTLDGTLLQEVRRGVDRAEIFSLALSPNVQWLAVASDKGTVHVFSLRVRVAGTDSSSNTNVTQGPTLCQQNSSTSLDSLIPLNTGSNPSSSLSFMRGVLPRYFSSEWSFAQFHLPEVLQFIAAFGSQNTIIIVGMDGRHSAGSLIAVNSYFQAPESVAALILVAPAILAPFGGQMRRDNQVQGNVSDSNAIGNPLIRLFKILSELVKFIVQSVIQMMKGMIDMVDSLYRKLLSAVLRSTLVVMLVRMIIDKAGILAIKNAWYDSTRVNEHVLHGYTKPLRTKNWDRALVEFVAAMLTDRASPPFSKRLHEISCPVLIITGDTDRLVPAWNAVRLSQAIPGSYLEVIKQCGHLPHEEKVDEFVSVVQKFLFRTFADSQKL